MGYKKAFQQTATTMSQESDYTLEQRHHFVGCSIITMVGNAMNQPQIVVLTAQNLYHRFYIRKSLREYDNFSIAMACFLLGAKIENKPQILRDVINEFFKTFLNLKHLPVFELNLGSDLYSLWKQELLALECEVLKELGFACYEDLDHPHFYALELWTKVQRQGNLDTCAVAAVPQHILNMLNDIMCFDLIVRFDSAYIVGAVILIAEQHFGVSGDKDLCEILCSSFSLNMEELHHLKAEILQTFSRVPQLQTNEHFEFSQIYEDGCSKIITWIEPIAKVPFLELTEERSRDGN